MPELPSMDDILHQGAKRESRGQVVLGAILLGGGLAFLLGMRHLGWDGRVPTFGAIGLGAGLLLRGLFGGPR
jgi:hypothetical protein